MRGLVSKSMTALSLRRTGVMQQLDTFGSINKTYQTVVFHETSLLTSAQVYVKCYHPLITQLTD